VCFPADGCHLHPLWGRSGTLSITGQLPVEDSVARQGGAGRVMLALLLSGLCTDRGQSDDQETGGSSRTGLLSIRPCLGHRTLGVPLAGCYTEFVRGWGNRDGKGPIVAGAGMSCGHREAEALQEAGEEEEELHAGQGLPEAHAAACGGRGSVSLGPGPTLQGAMGRDREPAPHRHLLRTA
jgi:hypothetical protein